MFQKYYQILEIDLEANEKALKKAFRNQALKFHPDINKADDAKERFQQLCEAYEVVLHKIRHDSTIKAGIYEPEHEDSFSYEEILREARQKSYERVKMKYEKMKAEKDYFEESNWRDIILLFNYIGRIVALPLAIFLIAFPLVVAIKNGIQMFFALFFFWIIGGILLNQFISNRDKWFKLGKIRWKLIDFYNLFDFSPVDTETTTECYYCNGKKADGKNFVITLLKVNDVRIRNDGVLQHYVAYDRKFKKILFPRSTKAFSVHYFQSLIKVLSLIICLIWIPFPSYIWRFAAGLILGAVLSSLLCNLTSTLSKVSYLLNAFIIIKIVVWGIIIMTQTTVYPGLVLKTSVYTPLYLVFLFVFGDMIMDLILRQMPFYSRLYIPLQKQSPNVMNYYKNGYQNYLDIPVWSTLYPLVRWFV